jgi:hypothetical protein
MNEGLENIKQIDDLENKVKNIITSFSEYVLSSG